MMLLMERISGKLILKQKTDQKYSKDDQAGISNVALVTSGDMENKSIFIWGESISYSLIIKMKLLRLNRSQERHFLPIGCIQGISSSMVRR
jgi:hypothetical protein